jgi:hypothetical protein
LSVRNLISLFPALSLKFSTRLSPVTPVTKSQKPYRSIHKFNVQESVSLKYKERKKDQNSAHYIIKNLQLKTDVRLSKVTHTRQDPL